MQTAVICRGKVRNDDIVCHIIICQCLPKFQIAQNMIHVPFRTKQIADVAGKFVQFQSLHMIKEGGVTYFLLELITYFHAPCICSSSLVSKLSIISLAKRPWWIGVL